MNSSRTQREGYSDEFRSRHEAEQAQRAAEDAQRKRDNEANRRAHLAEVEAEREKKRQQEHEAVEAQLEPERQLRQRLWLAEHPGRTAEDFARYAWPQLRAQLLVDGRRDAVEEAKARLRATGEYRF